jgi:hypothetical protein
MMSTLDIDRSGDNPPSLIQSALSGSILLMRLLMTAFQINSDLQAISRVDDSLQQISQVRQKHVEESRSVLRGTSSSHTI